MMRISYRGETHLAEDRPGGMAMIVCSRSVLLPDHWVRASDGTKLTCKDCRAYERRTKKEGRT